MPSTRSERPQSLSWRSGSTPGRWRRRSVLRTAGSGASGAPRSSATVSRIRRLVRPPSATLRVWHMTRWASGVLDGWAGWPGPSGLAAAGFEHRLEAPCQLAPVAGSDDPVRSGQLGVPRVEDRGAHDAVLAGILEVHRAVVHQHVDAQLHAAGDL